MVDSDRKGYKQMQGVSSRKPLLLGSANIGQTDLSESFTLERDAEHRQKWILNAQMPSFHRTFQLSYSADFFENRLEKSKTGVKRKNQAKRTRNIKTLQAGIKLVKDSRARLTSEQVRLSSRVK